MGKEEKGTGAITGITNFLFLAFILPGVIFLCFILLLFPFTSIKALLPELEMGLNVAIGAIVFLGLVVTSVIFALEIFVRWLCTLVSTPSPTFKSYSEVIFEADRDKELGWYFWQLWGQKIMHLNIGCGVLLIYVIYKYANQALWPPSLWLSSWKDFTAVIIVANFICYYRFSQWHSALMSRLMTEAPVSVRGYQKVCK
jgi:hypothetical protein